MKHTKRLACILLVLMFVLSLGSTVLADSKTTDSGSDSVEAEVTATAEKADAVPDTVSPVYSLKIEWVVTPGVLTVGADSYLWNPETHMYDRQVPNSSYSVKSDAFITVTVTNSSNKDMDINLKSAFGSQFNLPPEYYFDETSQEDIPTGWWHTKTVGSAAVYVQEDESLAPIRDLTTEGIDQVIEFTNYPLTPLPYGIAYNLETAFSIGSVVITVAPHVETT